MIHPLALRLRAQRLAAEDDFTEQMGGLVVDALVPRLKQRIPEISEAFVAETMPRVQQRLIDLQPQLSELAVTSAQAVLSDPAIRETVKQAVAESAEGTKKEIKSGLVKLGAGILLGVLVIEMLEPWLPGRR